MGVIGSSPPFRCGMTAVPQFLVMELTVPENRRTREELRRLLIEAGAQVLLEEGLGTGAEHLTFKRVYDKLEATAGVRITNASVIGRIWDSQAEFQTDVLCTFARESGSSALEETLAAGASALTGCDRSSLDMRRRAVVEALRQASAAHIDAIFRADTWPPWVGVWAVATAGSHGGLRSPLEEALVVGYEEVTRRYEEQYAAMLAFCGFRIRSPLTLGQLTASAGALAEGLALRERVDPASTRGIERPTGPDGSSQTWTLFGLALVALVESFIEPDPEWDEARQGGGHPGDRPAGVD